MDNAAKTRRRTLVVDDDEVMRELLSALLELNGDEAVYVASSGEDALAWLKTSQPLHVILTDLQMPGLQGDELISALRHGAQSDTLLVGMSGSHPAEAALRRMDAFIAKPFGSEELEEAMQVAALRRSAHSGGGGQEQLAPVERSVSQSGDPVPGEAPILDETVFSAFAARFPRENLVEIYTLTLDDVAERHRRMEEHAAAGNLAELQHEAHAVKGGCGMVGARELQALAASIEGGTTPDTSKIAQFPAASARLRRMLDAKFKV